MGYMQNAVSLRVKNKIVYMKVMRRRIRMWCMGIMAWGMFCASNEVGAMVKLPSLVGDRMVLQRETDLKIWGWPIRARR